MKYLLLFFYIGLSAVADAQSLAQAEAFFDRFEYASAARTYEEIAKNKKLDVESRKKFAYCYYAIGEYQNCFPLVDSLIKLKEIEPFFLFMHGNVAMEQGKFDLSKSSFESYKAKDDEFNVDMLIRSCDSLKVWKSNEEIILQAYEENLSKADLNGGSCDEGYFIFKESGIDSSGVQLNTEQVDQGEVILAQAYYVSGGQEPKKVIMPSEFKLAAITSSSQFPGTDKFLITLTQPTNKIELYRTPHLYSATFEPTSGFTNIIPWTYSGLEDTTVCAYATINKSGDKIIFSKQGRNTRSSDLYMSDLSNGSWTKPTSIATLNTEMDEMSPVFSGDSLLSFASNGRPGYGLLDIYTVKLNGNNFSEVQHPKAPVNSFRDDLNFAWLNDTLALLTSNRSEGKGDDDIYRITAPKVIPVPVIDTTNQEYEQFLASWTDKKILFDFDQYSINDQKVIVEIATALKKFDGLKIEIEGHTDIRGNEFYNIELSKQRAQTVRNEFIKLGVNGDNLFITSKGETEALVDCSKGCTEVQHQQNRVAIIKIKN